MTLAFTPSALVGAVALGALAAAPAAARDEVADLVERVAPAVVTIIAEQPARADAGRGRPDMPPPLEEFFRRFGAPGGPEAPRGPRRRAAGMGSGFVLDGDGYIVTNDHVVDDATRVTVRLADDRELEAEVLGTDPETDLALLKVAATDLPHVTLGDSDAVRVGQDVIAVGNPFGLGGTVTRGIVSAVSRDINAGPYVDFIQTDAAINRGNSGGPLFNMDGEVVGVNASIFSPNGGSVGVGFAIPANDVEMVVAQLREHGSVERGRLGVTIQPVTPDIAAALGMDAARGALVASVADDAPAAEALRPGDVILRFGGAAVEESRDLPRLVGATRAGGEVAVELLRDGEILTVAATVGRLGGDRAAAATPDDRAADDAAASASLGVTVAPLTDAARARAGLTADAQGLLVTALEADGPAARAGLRVGDVVTRVGDREIRDAADLEAALQGRGDRPALLRITRGGAPLWLGVPLG